MNSQYLISVALSVSLAACGGDSKPAPAEPQQASPPAPSAQQPSSPAATAPTPTASTPTAPAPQQPSPQASQPAAQQPANGEAGTTEPAKAPVKRPKVNTGLVKMLFGNETSAPKAERESSEALVMLGDKLYHATALSKQGNLSCNTCHDLRNYGVDNKPTSPGSDGTPGDRNSPTTYNAFRQFAQFWDYREPTVEAQAIGPVLNPIEHGVADEAELIAKIKAQPELVAGFEMAFGAEQEPVNAKNFQAAIGAFERTLVTRSRWDNYLDGDQKALSNEELVGLNTFLEVGCQTCHINRTLGGQMPQKLGLVKPYDMKDTGRERATGNVAEKYFFKVPMLLNVAKTAPYYHDGSVATLEEAVEHMALVQLGKQLTKEQTAAIVTFLDALTGELPEKFAKK